MFSNEKKQSKNCHHNPSLLDVALTARANRLMRSVSQVNAFVEEGTLETDKTTVGMLMNAPNNQQALVDKMLSVPTWMAHSCVIVHLDTVVIHSNHVKTLMSALDYMDFTVSVEREQFVRTPLEALVALVVLDSLVIQGTHVMTLMNVL